MERKDNACAFFSRHLPILNMLRAHDVHKQAGGSQSAFKSRRSDRHASSSPLSFKTMLLISCSARHNSVKIDTRRKILMLPAITDKLGSVAERCSEGGAAAALPSRFEYREM